MLQFRGHAVSYGEIWYDEIPPERPAVDILIHRLVPEPIPGARSTPFLTLHTDLSPAKSAIFDKFHQAFRQKIRRVDKDGLRVEFIRDPADRLEEFIAFYDSFAKQKSIWFSDRKWLASACNAGQLVLTSARQGDEALVWHAYLVCGKYVHIQYSGSCFRDKDNDFRSLIGRANPWLHWQDMVRFQELGVAWYDWGGLFADESTPERAGINRFKRSFGGIQVRSFDCTVPVTLRGRIWLPLRDAWRRWNKPHPALLRAAKAAGDAPPDSSAIAS